MAETVVGVLSDEDILLFRRMAAEFARRRPGGPVRHARPPAGPDQPWNRVVLTPPGGIPAMWEEYAGPGTGSGTVGDDVPGTGSMVGSAGDRPGFADCQAFYLWHATTASRPLNHPRLEQLDHTVRVYNATFSPIPGGRFVVAKRDPFGDWWTDGADAAGGRLVVITDKTYADGARTPTYGGWFVTELGNGSYERGDEVTLPIYHLQTADLPVWFDGAVPGTGTGSEVVPPECVVRAELSATGGFYLVDDQPRMDIIKKRTPTTQETVNGVTYVVGDLMRYDQETHELVRVKKIYILDVSAIAAP